MPIDQLSTDEIALLDFKLRQNIIELNDNFVQWGVEPNLVYNFYSVNDIYNAERVISVENQN